MKARMMALQRRQAKTTEKKSEPINWLELSDSIRFYFGENIGELTLPQIMSRIEFLHGGGSKKNASQSNGIASVAKAIMGKTGRKEIGLGEVLGMIG